MADRGLTLSARQSGTSSPTCGRISSPLGLVVSETQLITTVLQYCIPIKPPVELRIREKTRLTIVAVDLAVEGKRWLQCDLYQGTSTTVAVSPSQWTGKCVCPSWWSRMRLYERGMTRHG
jgi:hypothetical protein